MTIEIPKEWTEELDSWSTDFEAFHASFAHLFARREPRQQAAKYMRGLMSDVRRKNGWQLAEVVGDERPDATQRLLYHAKWDADSRASRSWPWKCWSMPGRRVCRCVG
jgi:hypothetical protein